MQRAGLACLLVAAAAGCEAERLSAVASLAVEPPAVEFGAVPAGETRTAEVRLVNPAPSATLVIESVALAVGSAAAFRVDGAPAQVPPGGAVTVRVTYAPDDAEPDAGHLEVVSNAGGGAVTRVPLSSARTTPRIAVDPPALDFDPSAAGEARRVLRIRSVGDATLDVARVSLATRGFAGEVCLDHADCGEGRCLPSASGAICALPCDGGCPAGYACAESPGGERACLEAGDTRPPTALRGFALRALRLDPILPGRSAALEVVYTPGPLDRGGARLVIESSDPERPAVSVPLRGRPDDLPPVARAALASATSPLGPGGEVLLDGEASSDPEGLPLTHRWRLAVRPDGSGAAFDDATAARARFVVDRPGRYVAALEVRDAAGQASTNEARVEVEAGAGRRVRVTLDWDRPGADLDLHLVSPGSPAGSLGDCFAGNPSPDWAPAGPGGDPSFAEAGPAAEAIDLEDPAPGVYAVLVRVTGPSPAGAAGAVVRLHLDGVVVATHQATLRPADRAWDVLTLSWPSGRLTPLETIR